jgi:hypothetical protein
MRRAATVAKQQKSEGGDADAGPSITPKDGE